MALAVKEGTTCSVCLVRMVKHLTQQEPQLCVLSPFDGALFHSVTRAQFHFLTLLSRRMVCVRDVSPSGVPTMAVCRPMKVFIVRAFSETPAAKKGVPPLSRLHVVSLMCYLRMVGGCIQRVYGDRHGLFPTGTRRPPQLIT